MTRGRGSQSLWPFRDSAPWRGNERARREVSRFVEAADLRRYPRRPSSLLPLRRRGTGGRGRGEDRPPVRRRDAALRDDDPRRRRGRADALRAGGRVEGTSGLQVRALRNVERLLSKFFLVRDYMVSWVDPARFARCASRSTPSKASASATSSPSSTTTTGSRAGTASRSRSRAGSSTRSPPSTTCGPST